MFELKPDYEQSKERIDAFWELSKVLEVARNDEMCTSSNCRSSDVTVFLLVRHRRNERLVPGNHRLGKGPLHRRDEPVGLHLCDRQRGNEVTMHLFEDLS